MESNVGDDSANAPRWKGPMFGGRLGTMNAHALMIPNTKRRRFGASSRLRHAFAERWVRSVKQECLSKVILFGEGPLSRVLAEYSRHYHSERNHQGKGNHLLFPEVGEKRNPQRRSIEC